MFVLFKPFVLYFDDVHWMVLVTVDSMCCEVMAELPLIHFKFALVSMFVFFGGGGICYLLCRSQRQQDV